MQETKLDKLIKLIHLTPFTSYLTIEEAVLITRLNKSLLLPIECALYRDLSWLFTSKPKFTDDTSEQTVDNKPITSDLTQTNLQEKWSDKGISKKIPQIFIKHPLDYEEDYKFNKTKKDNDYLFDRTKMTSFLENVRVHFCFKMFELPNVKFICNEDQARLLNSQQMEKRDSSLLLTGFLKKIVLTCR